MLSKTTVLALLTVLALANQTHENKGDASNMGNNGDYMNRDDYKFDDQAIAIVIIFYAICLIIVGGINIFLCMKCFQKRSVSKRIKEQMLFKRMEFATNNGLNLQQLNDPRFSQTIHV